MRRQKPPPFMDVGPDTGTWRKIKAVLRADGSWRTSLEAVDDNSETDFRCRRTIAGTRKMETGPNLNKRPSASMGMSETNGVGDIQDWVASYTSLSLQVEDNGLANGDCILPVVVVVVLHHVAALTQAMVSTKDSKHTLLI